MQIGLNLRPVAEVKADALVVFGFQDARPQLDLPPMRWINELYDSGEFTGERFSLAVLHQPEGLRARRLVLTGCGKQAEFDSARLRLATAAAIRSLKSKAIKRLALLPDPASPAVASIAAAVEGALIGAYEPDRYKTDPKKEESRVESFSVVVPPSTPTGSPAKSASRCGPPRRNTAPAPSTK